MNNSRETAFSSDYDRLYDLLRYEKDHGYVVWVLGPAVAFDYDSRNAMSSLAKSGYVDALFAGNALATHDLEASFFHTALGQDIYSKCSCKNGHYHHIETINRAHSSGSLKNLIHDYNIREGIVHACLKKDVPMVLAGSIRDGGPLPGVYSDVYEAQDAMRPIRAGRHSHLSCDPASHHRDRQHNALLPAGGRRGPARLFLHG